jgi:hypothetical protein
MSKEGRQALMTIVLAALVSAVLVWLAWVSMAALALVPLGTLLGLAVGGYLGYRYGIEQRQQTRRARRRRVTSRGVARRKP